MKNITQRLIINVDKKNNIPVWEFKQEDDGVLLLSLYKNSIELNLEGQKLKLGCTRADDAVIELTEGITINGNNVDIQLKNNILAKAGFVECDLEISDSTGKMTTATFIITVSKKMLGTDNIEASNDVSAINKLIADVQAKAIKLDVDIKKLVQEANSKITEIDNRVNERLLVIQKDYDSLKKVIIDENAAANLQDQVNQTNAQLDTKANNSKVNDLQGQINNLVLGAVGDGNNPEVIQARGNYTLLNDRFNLIESGYKKVDLGYIDLSNSDFVNSTPNRIVTNGVPITEKGIITVSYVPKQDHVYIQHLRYNTTAKKFAIIESIRVNCRQDTINSTVCNFNIDTSGNDYIAIEGIGFTTNDKSIGYMFLQSTFFEQNTGITEYNTPLQKVYTVSFGYYITVSRLDIDDIKTNLSSLNTEVEDCANSLKIIKYTNEQEQVLNMLSGGFWNESLGYIQANSNWTSFWYNSTPINVVHGEVYRITNAGGTGNLHPILFANSKEVDSNGHPYIKSMYPDSSPISLTVFNEILIKVPENVDLMYINSHTQSGNSISDLHLYKVLDAKFEYIKGHEVIDIKNNVDKIKEDIKNLSNNNVVDMLEFELNNLKTKCTKYDNFDFTWKTMDKSYFAITIDDSNEYLAGFYDVAHTKNVPISTACVHVNLNNKEKNGNRTIREINNLIVADGGEILAHYYGSPNENTSYEEWLTYTRDVKKALTEEGWNIRGLIRADRTQANTKKAEYLCKHYYDYADTMGTSNQYNLGLRKFLIGVQTLDEFKAWIDNCCLTPGFYPICVHGGRTDEPLATNDNMELIIDYIKSKSNTAFTTYSEIFDKFGCTTIEKKLESL